MSDQVPAWIEKLYLWQFSLLVSLALMALGFTGDIPFTDVALREGKETMAILAGVAFFGLTVVLRYIPVPDARRRNGNRSRVAIHQTQIALISRFSDWTDFDEAAQVVTSDYDLTEAELRVKNTELRIELATHQGIAMRQVTSEGTHQIKWRPEDA